VAVGLQAQFGAKRDFCGVAASATLALLIWKRPQIEAWGRFLYAPLRAQLRPQFNRGVGQRALTRFPNLVGNGRGFVH
jgi:hypothetical protein